MKANELFDFHTRDYYFLRTLSWARPHKLSSRWLCVTPLCENLTFPCDSVLPNATNATNITNGVDLFMRLWGDRIWNDQIVSLVGRLAEVVAPQPLLAVQLLGKVALDAIPPQDMMSSLIDCANASELMELPSLEPFNLGVSRTILQHVRIH